MLGQSGLVIDQDYARSALGTKKLYMISKHMCAHRAAAVGSPVGLLVPQQAELNISGRRSRCLHQQPSRPHPWPLRDCSSVLDRPAVAVPQRQLSVTCKASKQVPDRQHRHVDCHPQSSCVQLGARNAFSVHHTCSLASCSAAWMLTRRAGWQADVEWPAMKVLHRNRAFQPSHCAQARRLHMKSLLSDQVLACMHRARLRVGARYASPGRQGPLHRWLPGDGEASKHLYEL